MKGDAKVIDYLNEALKNELTGDQPIFLAQQDARQLGRQQIGQV